MSFVVLSPPTSRSATRPSGAGIEFGDDGRARGLVDSFLVRLAFPIGDEVGRVQVLFNGPSAVEYLTLEGNVLSVSNPVEDIDVLSTTSIAGVSGSLMVPLDPPVPVSSIYTCEGDRLHLLPADTPAPPRGMSPVDHPGLWYSRVGN